jgi:radical SAM superfamily enzyme YgiQ (UPF0313 family)
MKIAFVVTAENYLRRHLRFPHIGFGYMISSLEEIGYRCLYVDLNFDTIEPLKSFSPDIIGISLTSSSYNDDKKIINTIKNQIPAKIVVGGPHVQIVMGEILNIMDIDYAVYGEGEKTIIELVGALQESNSPDKLSDIKGLIFREDGEVIVNPPRPWIEFLDTLPFPGHHHFQKYPYERHPILTNRGCPFNCIYCAIGLIWGRKVRSRSAHNIIEEIEFIVSNWGTKPFVTLDDTFNLNINRTKDICNLLIQKNINIRWSCWSFRADIIDQELAYLMAKSGCKSVSVGIESANPEVLKSVKKGETVEDITRGINILNRAGIQVFGNFMIGNPGDTLETIKESIQYAKKMRLDAFRFYLALPYPKTELWNYIQREGRFIYNDYTRFSHLSDSPVFETDAFPIKSRKEAFRLAARASKMNNFYNMFTKKRNLSDIVDISKRLAKNFTEKLSR